MKTSSILVLLLAVRLCRSEELEQPPRPVSRPVVRFPAEGGSKGAPFDDLHKISSSVFNIHSIAIGSGRHVDSIQVTYLLKSGSLYTAPKHGGGFKPPFTITLAADEYVAKVEGSTSGNVVNQLTITTKRPSKFLIKEYGPFGKTPGDRNFTLTESVILGFLGSSGNHLNSIGIYCLAPINRSQVFGSFDRWFREQPDTEFPPAVKLSEIRVYHSWKISGLQFGYELHGGAKKMGDLFGPTDTNLTTIQMGPEEEFVGVQGQLAHAGTFLVVYQLTFISQNSNTAVQTSHGPFGPSADESFSLQGHILGFEGSLSDRVGTIRFYYY